jgi:hypothetical protein
VSRCNEETSHAIVTSADGTKIAYEQQGSGPPLIIVDGALSTLIPAAASSAACAGMSASGWVFSVAIEARSRA